MLRLTVIHHTWLVVALALAFQATGSAALAESPLADAVEKADFKAVVKLIAEKIDVNAAQADGMTALHWAAYHDDVETVRRLIAAKVNVNAVNRYDVTPLWLACTNGSSSIVAMLLEAGADPNARLAGGETPLMTASRAGIPGPVLSLIQYKADVNVRDRKGQTALMWAAAEGNVEVVSALLKAGADDKVALSSGFDAFFFAIREGRSKVVASFLATGTKVNDLLQPRNKDGSPTGKATNALLLALENGHFELAIELLKAGANPDARPSGYAALHAVSWVRKPIRGDGDPPPIGSGDANSLDVVRALAAHGADINIRLEKGESGRGRFTTTGSTPFLLAARTGDIPLMKLLLELKADPRLMNADNTTPLLAASGVGALLDGDEAAATEDEAVAAMQFLLDKGADVNAVDDNGETAMHGAAYQSLPKVVALLAAHKADIKIWNQKDKWGWTPLLIAEGHRPGNFRPAPETIAAIHAAMKAAGVAIPPPAKGVKSGADYKSP